MGGAGTAGEEGEDDGAGSEQAEGVEDQVSQNGYEGDGGEDQGPHHRGHGVADPVAPREHKYFGSEEERRDQSPCKQDRQVGWREQEQERYPDDAYGEHDAEHEEGRQGQEPVHERPSRRLLGPARGGGERARGEHRGQHGAGRKRERRDEPADKAEYFGALGLVEV